MKKLLLLLWLAAGIQGVSAVSVYEPFANATTNGGSAYATNSVFCQGFSNDVPANFILTTNASGVVWGCISNLAGAPVTAVPVITNGNLTYPGLSNALGNSLFIPAVAGNMARTIGLPFGPVGTGVCYYSFLLKVTDVSTLSTSPKANFFIGLGDGSGAQRAAVARAQAFVVAEKSGSGYKLGVGKSPPNSTNNTVYDTTVHNAGDVLLVVASFDDTAPGHPAALWVNPATNTFGALTPPSSTLSTTNGTNELNAPSGVQCVMVGCYSAAPPACVVDDIRVGLTWAVVTGAADIQTPPQAAFVNAGATATFSVFATGALPLSYQWLRAGTNLSNGGNISGAGTAALSIANATLNEQDNYLVIVSNSYGAVTSSVAALSVQDPGIDAAPTNQILPPGARAVFTVTAGGLSPLTYGWYKDGVALTNGGTISGAQTASLTLNNISFSDAGGYTVYVTNGVGNFVQSSPPATLTVTDPAIVTAPQSATNLYGSTATFQVTATGRTGLSYQWHGPAGVLSDGGNISGSHTSTLTVSNVSYTAAGPYYVTVTDGGGSADSVPASLTVIEPLITSQPVSLTNNQSTTATFTVGAVGAPVVTYQWSKNGAAYAGDGGNISGSQTATLTVSGLTAADDGTYSVRVTDASGMSTNSSGAVLLVLTAPVITVQPQPLAITPGNNASFAAGVSGTGPITYYWYSNSVNVSAGAVASYTLTNVQLGMSGGFFLIASNSLGAATSSVVALTVVPSIHLYKTNLVVVRVGDGAQAQDFAGNSVFLDQYTTGGTYLNTICIPDSGASALIEIGPDVNGATITGTQLSLSEDGLELVFGGYNTPRPASTSLFNSTAASVPRGVAMVNSGGHYLLPISDNSAYSATYFRGAASDGTNNFWGAGNAGGTYYFGTSAPAGTIQSTFPNLRSVSIFNGQLYSVSGSSGGVGILEWTNNTLPTNATEPVNLFLPGATPTDMALDATGTNMYLGTSLGIMNYQFASGTWNFKYTITASAVRYLTVDFSQQPPVIYATTSDSVGDRLLAIVDNGPSSGAATLATAGVNQNLRGVRFGPSDPYFTFTHDANNIVLLWNGLYNLQASTNLAAGFTTIPAATSPYTNAFTNASQVFFRLQQ